MTIFRLFCVFISNIVAILTATPSTETCVKTLSLCTFDVGGDGFISTPQVGPRGYMGEPGDLGEPGEMGSEDWSAPKKRYGGMQGSKGLRGPTGFDGANGLPGMLGKPGSDGLKGEQGDMGIPGPIGPPGSPGENGSCSCSNTANSLSPSPLFEFGDAKKPAKVVCKASTGPVKTGEYYIGPNPMKVKCVSRTNTTTLTCIPPVSAEQRTFTYKNKLWLSQKGLTIEEIYGINRDQLTWVQSRSNLAFQTIRYHCLNSNPFPRDNANNSILLLSWNDNTIGPMPTLTKPFFYTVPTESDGCSNATDSEWSFTDIKLVSNSIPRVPVIDFYIRDIRLGKTQSVKIEHIELCFD